MNQELLNKYIAGDATPEEKEEVARWLDTDKKNMNLAAGSEFHYSGKQSDRQEAMDITDYSH